MRREHKNRFSKKSQGLSINVIIIVAIALLVLVVLIAIFTGRLGSFAGGLSNAVTCESACSSVGKGGGASVGTDVSASYNGLRNSQGEYCSCAGGQTLGSGPPSPGG